MATSTKRKLNFCIGCGHNTTPSDTRSLHGDDAKQVISTWKAFVEHVCENTTEVFNACGDPSEGKMCRKCFSMYTRFSNLQFTIEDAISEGIKVMVPSATPIKRSRLHTPTQHKASVPQVVGNSSHSSPDVAVSF